MWGHEIIFSTVYACKSLEVYRQLYSPYRVPSSRGAGVNLPPKMLENIDIITFNVIGGVVTKSGRDQKVAVRIHPR